MISGRKDCRSGEHRCKPTIEAEALYCQGNHAQATRNELAEAMEVNPSTLGNWLDPHHASRIPDDRKQQLLRLTDDHTAFVCFHAHEQGLVVFDPKQARGKGVTRIVSEFGEFLQKLDDITALRPGEAQPVITADEARQLEQEADDLHAAVNAKVIEIKRAAGVTEAK